MGMTLNNQMRNVEYPFTAPSQLCTGMEALYSVLSMDQVELFNIRMEWKQIIFIKLIC